MKTRSIKPIMMSLQLLLVLVLFTSACGQKENSGSEEMTLTLNTPEASGQSDSARQSDKKDNFETPKEDIHMAIISGHKDIVEQHIKAGTDLNQKEQMSGSTPLLTAITFNKTAIAELLVNAGTDLSITNNDGSTALHNAAFFCRIDMVKLLLDARADKTAKNQYGMTPRDLVLADYNDMKPVYEMVSLQLKPMGFTLDLEEVQKARPVVAMMLE